MLTRTSGGKAIKALVLFLDMIEDDGMLWLLW
jgi:hypothetical protein